MLRLLIFLAALAVAGAASAGAWTQPSGAGFAAQEARYFTTALSAPDDEAFRKATSATYLEYGLRDGVTIGGALDIDRRLDQPQASELAGALAGFVRARLWTGAGGVVSVQLRGAYPVEELTAPGVSAVNNVPEAEARLLYGRGFASPLGDGWIDASVAYRHRTRLPADELRFDLTIGMRPAPRWVVLAQSFNIRGLRDHGFTGPDFDSYKLGVAIGFEIDERRTLLFGARREIAARNLERGAEAAITLWTTF